jgi:hypothetical protein
VLLNRACAINFSPVVDLIGVRGELYRGISIIVVSYITNPNSIMPSADLKRESIDLRLSVNS